METTTPQTETEPRRAARWEDLVDIFLSPAQLFRRRAEDSWLTPFIILSVISFVLYYVFLPANSAVMDAAMRARLPAGAQAPSAGAVHTFQLLGGLFVPVGIGISVVFSGLLLWGMAVVTGGGLRFGQSVLITVYAAYVGILQQILASVLIILKSNQGAPIDVVRDFSFGLVRFLPKDAVPAALVPLLGRIDLFALWQAALWAVGVAVIAKTSRGRAILVAAGAWLIYAIPGMIRAAVFPGPTPG